MRHTKKALINRKDRIKISKSSLSLSSSDKIFINENLIPVNNNIVCHYIKLKQNDQIDKTYSRDGIIHIASSNIRDKKVMRILHMRILLDVFPRF